MNCDPPVKCADRIPYEQAKARPALTWENQHQGRRTGGLCQRPRNGDRQYFTRGLRGLPGWSFFSEYLLYPPHHVGQRHWTVNATILGLLAIVTQHEAMAVWNFLRCKAPGSVRIYVQR